MSLLTEVGQYLTTNTTLELWDGTTSSTGDFLVLSQLPDPGTGIPQTMIGMLETVGLAPVHTFTTSTGVRLYEQPRLQLVARSTSYEQARALAQVAFAQIDGRFAFSGTTGSTYIDVAAVQSPFHMGYDREGVRPLVGFNVQVRG